MNSTKRLRSSLFPVSVLLLVLAANFICTDLIFGCGSQSIVGADLSQSNSTIIAQVHIDHPYCGDLVVTLGVGDPNTPDWSINLWNHEGGDVIDLNLTIDVSAAAQYLPPSDNSRWFLKVYDVKKEDQGQITRFTITYNDETYASTCIPVPISDFQTSFSYIPGVPLELAISRRLSTRDFPAAEDYSRPPVSWEHLSRVLWAGYGYSTWGRTVPNICEIPSLVIYVCNKTAIYKYNPATQSLALWKEGDYRWGETDPWPTWGRTTVHPAPIELFFAMDTNLCPDLYLGYMEVGAAIQNIYLQANTLGLGTCCVSVDREAVEDAFDLPTNEFVLFDMPLGHPESFAFYNFSCVAPPESSELPQVKQSSVFLDYTLQERNSAHDWRASPLTPQEVSQILWAAYGQSYLMDMRPSFWTFQYRHRSVASAHHDYPLTIWMVNSTAIYRYDYLSHRLILETEGDKRPEIAEACGANWMSLAPTILVMAYDSSQMTYPWPEAAYTEMGLVLQNVHLESVAWGLVADWATVVKEDTIKSILGFEDATTLHPVAAITVGHPSHYWHKVLWNGTAYSLSVSTNSSVTNFAFNELTKTEGFEIVGTDEGSGFCNVTIPTELLTGPFKILVDDTSVDFVSSHNGTHSFLFFTYSNRSRSVKIVGTTLEPDILPPTAVAGYNQTVNAGMLTTLDGSNSSDNVGITRYTWTFVDVTPQTLTGVKPHYTFETPGVYAVTLTVFDARGNWDEDAVFITVLDVTTDTDGDGTPDVTDTDDDDDGLPDAWETAMGLDPLDPTDAFLNPDGDGLTNLQEYQKNTDPHNYFSPFPMWIAGVALVAVVIVAVVLYLLKIRKQT